MPQILKLLYMRNLCPFGLFFFFFLGQYIFFVAQRFFKIYFIHWIFILEYLNVQFFCFVYWNLKKIHISVQEILSEVRNKKNLLDSLVEECKGEEENEEGINELQNQYSSFQQKLMKRIETLKVFYMLIFYFIFY